mmetsp:Transcript_33855/g.62695  ORF Transcript_33855/g.62695 Transcript_33855/m.62695 type:complete len:292 (-) Transcript_33855:239-1114(-)|eukprot:CAMPEP_0197463652 /NCGR_PEP_ID=MMETSP1175-20131217/62386_1 /TAXON_ID=1003142 /ORGANISM="Triceratium dubium, Strain CCMP147" /LENGTH=291 /DNA_ID=CAMNT_0042999469 /DNA_START=238 /DNA_END=1113 /DNA_ORIENTATION=+
MKLYITSSALIALLMMDKAYGGPINLCTDQVNCLQFTIEKNENPAQHCSGYSSCDYTICAQFDMSLPGCGKTDAISHTCLREPSECLLDPLFTTPVMTTDCIFRGGPEGVQVNNLDKQCQTVLPGHNAYFIFKDSNSCLDSTASKDVLNESDESDSGIDAFCYDTLNHPDRNTNTECMKTKGQNPKLVDNCGGNGEGVECQWVVEAPTGCAIDPCVAEEETCCPVQAPCTELLCESVIEEFCPPPPPVPWTCEIVCKQDTTPVNICEDTTPARRTLKEAAAYAHDNFLRGI